MLVYQGAAAFELWTGRGALFALMFQVAKMVLQGDE
jgi:shikimate 5-dehydrogenase